MSIIGSNILAGSSGAEAAYAIDYSILTSNADYISRTATETGHTGTGAYFTYSTWFKKSDCDTAQYMFWWKTPLAGTNAVVECFQIQADQRIRYNLWTGSASEANRYSAEYWRDPAAWHHLVIQWNGATLNMYMNNVLINMDTSGSINGNYWGWQSGNLMRIASSDGTNGSLGYTAETYYIEGQTVATTAFGEVNEDTGQWVPIEYEGTFTGNSFYLNFADSSDLGKDVSGLDNHFTTSGGIDSDNQVPDTPTNNFTTLNFVAQGYNNFHASGSPIFRHGNLQQNNPAGATSWPTTMELPTTGKWYWESYADANSIRFGLQMEGIQRDGWTKAYIYGDSGAEYPLGTVLGGTGYTSGTFLGIAVNLDDGEIKFYLDNVLQYTGTNMNTLGYDFLRPIFYHTDGSDIWVNFGQNSSFSGTKTKQGNQDANGIGDFYYAPPSDHLALCTRNIPSPEIALPEDNFNIVLWTGDASSPSPTRAVGFQPDFVWYKQRSGTEGQSLYDSVRGVQMRLQSSEINTQSTRSEGLLSFESTGFTTGNDGEGNGSGSTYVGWTWKGGGATVTNTTGDIESEVSANPTAGFSIVSYVGNATTSQTIGHGLSVAPELIIVKRYSGSYAWHVFPTEGATSANYDLVLNDTAAESSNTGDFGAYPSASVFTVQDGAACNESGANFITYLFHSVAGYSKVGIYGGNGLADGTFTYTGFRPAFVMTKSIDSTSDWQMFDDKRIAYNVRNNQFEANTNAAEDTSTSFIDILSNGFKNRIATDPNVAETYIYLAFASTPFKTANAR